MSPIKAFVMFSPWGGGNRSLELRAFQGSSGPVAARDETAVRESRPVAERERVEMKERY
jgi:hypothetical protein